MGDNAEEFSLELRGEGDGGIGGVLREESDGRVGPHIEALDGEFSADGGDDDITIAGGETAIHYQNVSVTYAGANHAFAACADEVGGGRVADAELIQIECSVELAHGRAGEACGNGFVEEGDTGAVVFGGLAHGAVGMIACMREKFNQNGIYT